MFTIVVCFLLALAGRMVDGGSGSKYPCPSLWKYNPENRKCYKVMIHPKNWMQARLHCRKYGAEMATVDNSQIAEFLYYQAPKRGELWVGLNDRGAEGEYRWNDDPSKPEFLRWMAGQPRSSGDCGLLAKLGQKNYMIMANCFSRKKFFCQKGRRAPPTAAPTTTQSTAAPTTAQMTAAPTTAQMTAAPTRVQLTAAPTTEQMTAAPTTAQMTAAPTRAQSTSAPVACPDHSWSLYEQRLKCVKMIQRKANWFAARENCKQLGGDLLAIPDQSTHDFVKGILGKQRFWIGLHDFDLDGRWNWLDESTETPYSSWANKPRNIDGGEYCVEMIGKQEGRWNDKDCNVKRRSICQYDLES